MGDNLDKSEGIKRTDFDKNSGKDLDASDPSDTEISGSEDKATNKIFRSTSPMISKNFNLKTMMSLIASSSMLTLGVLAWQFSSSTPAASKFGSEMTTSSMLQNNGSEMTTSSMLQNNTLCADGWTQSAPCKAGDNCMEGDQLYNCTSLDPAFWCKSDEHGKCHFEGKGGNHKFDHDEICGDDNWITGRMSYKSMFDKIGTECNVIEWFEPWKFGLPGYTSGDAWKPCLMHHPTNKTKVSLFVCVWGHPRTQHTGHVR